jgi:transcriptional regulator with XRE-family HTH domain
MSWITGKRLKQAKSRAGISSQLKFGLEAGLIESSSRMNQYFTGKHQPDVQIVKLLAAVVKTPACYFYCEDDQLADLILKFGSLDEVKKKRLLAFAAKL